MLQNLNVLKIGSPENLILKMNVLVSATKVTYMRRAYPDVDYSFLHSSFFILELVLLSLMSFDFYGRLDAYS